MTNIASFVHKIFDVVNKFIYLIVGAFILIIITYGTGIKNNKIFNKFHKIKKLPKIMIMLKKLRFIKFSKDLENFQFCLFFSVQTPNIIVYR